MSTPKQEAATAEKDKPAQVVAPTAAKPGYPPAIPGETIEEALKRFYMTDDCIIKATGEVNHRRPDTFGQKTMELVLKAGADGITIRDLKKSGGRTNDVGWDFERGYVSVTEPNGNVLVLPVRERKPAGRPAQVKPEPDPNAPAPEKKKIGRPKKAPTPLVEGEAAAEVAKEAAAA